MSYIIWGTDLGISRLQMGRKLLQIISSESFFFQIRWKDTSFKVYYWAKNVRMAAKSILKILKGVISSSATDKKLYSLWCLPQCQRKQKAERVYKWSCLFRWKTALEKFQVPEPTFKSLLSTKQSKEIYWRLLQLNKAALLLQCSLLSYSISPAHKQPLLD